MASTTSGHKGAIKAKQKYIKKLQAKVPHKTELIARKQAELDKLLGKQKVIEKKAAPRDPERIVHTAEGKMTAAQAEARVSAPTTPAKREPIQVQSPAERARIEKANREREEREEFGTKLATGLAITTGGAALGAAAGLLAGVLAVPTAASLGTKVGSVLHTASIHHWSKSTGMLVAKKGITLSKVPIIETAGRVGQPASKGIQLLFKAGANAAINSKTTALATSAVSKSFSTKALAVYGAWAGSVFLGKWAQAEAAEPITIPLRNALRQAQETGDWSIYDEYKAAAEEITNVGIWGQIISYSPFSAIPGILNKIKGVKKGIELIDKIATKSKEVAAEEAEAEPEETFEERVSRIREEGREIELEEREVDEAYYAEIEEKRQEVKEEEREEETAFWDELFEKRKAEKEKERIEDDLYWEEIYAKNQKRKAEEREADEAYWAEIKTKSTGISAGVGLTQQDKKVISNWNAGKSALNFKWLGR